MLKKITYFLIKTKNSILNEEGINSVFLTIIITVLLLLIFSFIDILRIYSSKNNLKEMSYVAINTVMCDYATELYNDYHLLGICYQNEFEIEDVIKNNLIKNINFTKFNKTNINDVKIIGGTKLNDVNEVKRQIGLYESSKLENDIYHNLFNSIISFINTDYSDSKETHDKEIKSVSEDEYENVLGYASRDTRDTIVNKINIDSDTNIVYEDDIDNVIEYEKYNIELDNIYDDSNNFVNEIKNVFDFKDDLFLTSYTMETFNSLITKKEHDSYFDAEIEYIISGSNSQNANIKKTKEKILLMIFPDKLLEISHDNEKVLEAELIACAVCGWWSSDVGVTICKNLILTSWALDEANSEYENLLLGNKYKLSYIDYELSYDDFLKIILLAMDDDTLTERIIKLININLKKYNCLFSMDTTYSNLTIRTDASEKLMFASRFCLPSSFRFNSNYNYLLDVSFGY